MAETRFPEERERRKTRFPIEYHISGGRQKRKTRFPANGEWRKIYFTAYILNSSGTREAETAFSGGISYFRRNASGGKRVLRRNILFPAEREWRKAHFATGCEWRKTLFPV